MSKSQPKISWVHCLLAVAAALAASLGELTPPNISAQSSGPGQPGVVAAYGFEEGTGTTTADSSGNSNTGTAASVAWTTSGRFGKALTFNGTSSRVNIPDAGLLDFTIGMTLEAWVKPTTVTGWQTVILKETTTGLAYSLYAHDGARPAAYINLGGADVVQEGTTALTANTWAHLAATYDGATLRFYVNGTQVGSRAQTGPLVTSTGALWIGGNALWGEYFTGSIDEVRLYGRALSASEIQADMAMPIVQTDATPPTVTLVSPAGGATGVPAATNVTATFSEAMNASTITSSAVELRTPANVLVPATVTYNATTFVATLDPTTDLTGGATYTATVRGGTTDPRVMDAAGNALASNLSWSFTVVPSDTTPPTVASTAPAAGATGIAVTANVTATFSEAMAAASIDTTSVELRTAANVLVPASVAYNAATFTVTLDPTADLASGATYTATIKGGGADPRVKDAAGNALAASAVFSFTTAPAASTCPCSIWAATVTPATPDFNDGGSVEVGVKFQADRAGTITGIRFYKGAGNTGTHVGHLWSAAGTLLGSVTFSSETATGWQQATFQSPVAITANTTYVASYFAPNGHYAVNAAYFNTAADNAPLHALATATSPNGVFAYNASGSAFPSQSYNAGNYWVDVVFQDGDTAPPVVSTQSPAPGATGVPTSTSVSAVFNKNIDPATATAATFELRTAAGVLVGSAVSYDQASRTITLQPSAALSLATTYNATLRGGAADPRVKDTSGNALAADVAWSFTTASAAPLVTATSPASGASGVALSTPVTATFDVAMNAATITTGSFELRTAGGVLVAATVSYDSASRTATLVPTSALGAATGYTATVRGGTVDPRAIGASGTALASNVVWSFTTAAAPVVTSVSPSSGATGVSVSTSVTATFDIAINAASVTTSSFDLRTPSNAVVPATVTYDAATRRATLQPSAALSYSTIYTATVRGGGTDPRITSAAGAPLASNVAWSFTTAAAPAATTYTIWNSSATPATPSAADTAGVELGVKFRSDRDGVITALRFYKGATNTGTHIGSLWTAGGTLLGSVTFANETASGWQQAILTTPIAITANTVYVASYYAPVGRYSVNGSYFTSAVDNAPLHALASSTSANGLYRYGSTAGVIPNQSYNASNYWVDVVFMDAGGMDLTPPVVSTQSPNAGATGVLTSAAVMATFSENIDPATISTSTLELRTAANGLIDAMVTYDTATRKATLQPTALLAASTTYTVTVRGGSTDPRVKDLAGNALAANATWSFTTTAIAANEGPGGPVLVVASTANPMSRYYGEILRTEGLNLFTVTDLSLVTATLLNSYDVVILGETPLTAAQVAMFTTWVNGGGNLIAMRPDKQLAGLLGLADGAATRANSYLLMDTAGAATGLVNQTIQYHGTADLYTVNGATAVAWLFSDANTGTVNPAVTLRSVGSNGGQAAAFTFDLARSIALTRQGNPAWSGVERDGQTPVRSDDLFFGAASGDVQPDWVDLSKVAIPQADEQQRLLANLVLQMNADRKPLPRLWYLPRGLKAAIVMTGDDHGNNGTAGRWDRYIAQSPSGCSVADWQCVRGTSYIYTSTPLTNAQAAAYEAQGFEVGLHVSSNCADWTPSSLAGFYSSQLAAWKAKYTSLAPIVTNRTHCIVWSDYVTQPKVELANGIRFDTTYYYWPAAFVLDRPGFFTGSGMPMRFTDLDGSTIDVFQAATQLTDESSQTFPYTINTLLDRALGAEGYYGVFTANMHTDTNPHAGSEAIVASALARGVPVVSSKQMLTWLDGRNASSIGSIAWSGNSLTFSIAQGAGANGLQGLLPSTSANGTLTGLSRDGAPVTYAVQTIKGISYATFTALSGSYTATYQSVADTTITSSPLAVSAQPDASFAFTSTPAAGATFECRLDGSAFAACTSPKSYSGLALGPHTFQVRATNGVGTDPTPASFSWTIVTQTTVVPASAVVLTGTLQSGSVVPNLGADDNTYYQVNSTTSGTRATAFYGSFTAPNELLTLSVSYRGRNTQSSCTQVIEIYRWSDGTWQPLDSRTVGTSEVAVLDLTASGVPADYVNGTSGNGEVRVRVATTRSGTTSFSTQADQVSITFGL